MDLWSNHGGSSGKRDLYGRTALDQIGTKDILESFSALRVDLIGVNYEFSISSPWTGREKRSTSGCLVVGGRNGSQILLRSDRDERHLESFSAPRVDFIGVNYAFSISPLFAPREKNCVNALCVQERRNVPTCFRSQIGTRDIWMVHPHRE